MIAGLTIRGAGELLRVTRRTVRNWEQGKARVPYSAFKLMRILSGYALPGEAWRGWCVRGDTLWSPEGRAFPAWGLGYLSLIFRMARQFSMEHGGTRSLPTDHSDRSSARISSGRVVRATAPGNPSAGVARSARRLTGGRGLPGRMVAGQVALADVSTGDGAGARSAPVRLEIHHNIGMSARNCSVDQSLRENRGMQKEHEGSTDLHKGL